MSILQRATESHGEVTMWRRHLHRSPELLFDVFETAGFVEEKLREFGCDEVTSGIARTGVVGIIRGRTPSEETIGLRADMDALPINEETGKEYASRFPGKMHACGHDGHTAMLLGAAKHLCETRNFMGSVAVIFQPAEEGGAGGKVMVEEGLMERFRISRVFGMHNLPGLPTGHFATRPGPIMAAGVRFEIVVNGSSGHAAMPHSAVDPIVVMAQLINALQTVVSRSVDPVDSVVLTISDVRGGISWNIIPERVEISGTIRALRAETASLVEQRMRDICSGFEQASKARIGVKFSHGYPVTLNGAAEAALAADAAAAVAGEFNVDRCVEPSMAGEDFSYMLQARPGALIFIGNGKSAALHHPSYDFNDEAIPSGVSYWVKLAEQALSADRPRDHRTSGV